MNKALFTTAKKPGRCTQCRCQTTRQINAGCGHDAYVCCDCDIVKGLIGDCGECREECNDDAMYDDEVSPEFSDYEDEDYYNPYGDEG